ncbi:hypothetical protein [Parasitella parasitica]|uniref:SMP-LTD domain-containing protein n=1 Tax=Parasitella parasitica TaxID=35722 RepID=A0A0B7NQG1_9FUNG|nr:hypothetical protein [Parasitella parasitica]
MAIPPLIEIIAIYLLGGITFIPVILFATYVLSSPAKITQHQEPLVNKSTVNAYAQNEKKGWIRLTTTYKPNGSESNVATILSYVQGSGTKRQKEHVYAELKCGALFIYRSDQADEDCKIIIPVHNYNVAMYNPSKTQQRDRDMYNKASWLKLTPKPEVVNMSSSQVLIPRHHQNASTYLTTHNELYMTCARAVDKEDWYFGLLAASQLMAVSSSPIEMRDTIHFDTQAMQTLIATVQQDAEYREVQWLNAILGRLFLSVYKMDNMRGYLQEKISKKAKKIKRPGILGDIVVQRVDIGDSLPYVTQPKLLSLTPEGDLEAEAMIHYAGGLRVVTQTEVTWTYSFLMKPIRLPLVLAVKLKRLSGKFIVKVKPPPTNRCWIGFYQEPVMEWEIQPILADKQIRLSMITNAIQSKICEFVKENIVLPNMDDFSFCSSGGLGGIFGERVPKPSSPRSAPVPSTPAHSNPSGNNMDLDMLGNRVNRPVVMPTVIASEPLDNEITITVRTPVRRATVGIMDASSNLDVESASTQSTSQRSRGYSNPILRRRSTSTSSSRTNSSNSSNGSIIGDIVSSPIITSALSTGRKMASNIGFRKRQPSAMSVSSFEEEPQAPGPINNTEYSTIAASINSSSIRDSDTGSVMSSTSSSATAAFRSSKKLLSKINAVSAKAAKLNAVAGNLFNKKKVTKEMLEKRNRELLESHNRKMMNLFLVNEPGIVRQTQLTPTIATPPSLISSSSSEDNLATTPTSSSEEHTQNATSIMFNEC